MALPSVRVGVHFLSPLPEAFIGPWFDDLYIRLSKSTGIFGYQLIPVRWLKESWKAHFAGGLVLSIDPAWNSGTFMDLLRNIKTKDGCSIRLLDWLFFGSGKRVATVLQSLLSRYPYAVRIEHHLSSPDSAVELNPRISAIAFRQMLRMESVRFVWDTKHAQEEGGLEGMFSPGWQSVLSAIPSSRLALVHLNLTNFEIGCFLRREGEAYHMLSAIYSRRSGQNYCPPVILELNSVTLLFRGRTRTLKSLVDMVRHLASN